MRRPAAQNKPRKAQIKAYPAPTAGWIANRNLAVPSAPDAPQGAEMLENFFPTAQKVVLRRGSQKYATLGDASKPVTSIFSYVNGSQAELFSSTQDAIYNITTITNSENYLLVDESDNVIVTDLGDSFGENSTENLDIFSGQTGGDWVVVQFATSGGVFLRGVNGMDTPFIYDGSTWGASPAITNVNGSNLSHVWAYKNRLFFVEKDSLNAWYLPVDSIGGSATKFPLGGVFTRGGGLMFGASWSLGEGAAGGLSAQCVFVSTEGEVAVYQGNDPASWSLVGVYRIGRPLGKTAYIRAGGDLVIATDIGFVPLSQALQKDYAALSPSAVSYPIEDAWRQAVELRRSEEWKCEIWPTQQMVVVALPTVNEQEPRWLVANARTGAWSSFTNWSATCVEVFQDRMFFGSTDGQVFEANVTGQDNDQPYTGAFVPLFDNLNRPGSRKIAKTAKAVIRSKFEINANLSAHSDYTIELPPAPDAIAVDASQAWGGATWGQSVWGANTPTRVQQRWQSVGSYGEAIAPAFQVSSGATVPIDPELIRIDLTFEATDIVA